MRFLLDTNVISDLRKTRPHPALLKWFDEQDGDDLFVSVITIGEIRQGIEQLRPRDGRRAHALDQWLADLSRIYADRVLPIDQTVAEDWGRLRAGRSIPVVDALLAATARVHGLTMVSRNEQDFAGMNVTVLNPSR